MRPENWRAQKGLAKGKHVRKLNFHLCSKTSTKALVGTLVANLVGTLVGTIWDTCDSWV
jgi:fluoride ion exporter CrcB/FEX